MNHHLKEYFKKNTEAAPLAVFRIFFGLMMLISIIRFWSYGWIDKLYIKPTFFFSYYGFDFIKPIGVYTYLIFALCGISSVFVAIGFKYRIAIITFFLSFTYIELMDKTTYLNHYYFISILSFLFIFLPANAYYSLDAKIKRMSFQKVPSWTIDAVKLLLGIVYFYAGLAKLNSDWLLKAMPLKIWLPSKYDIPLIGDLMQQEWVHYTFSYTGAIYDLTIPFLLLCKRTRVFGFAMVVLFHVLTRVLFPIGMFPYIMIVGALIFFDSSVHHKILQLISKICNINKASFDTNRVLVFLQSRAKIMASVLGLFFVIQVFLPFRYMLYPGELFWTEEGYRFSWRVMLMEKAGYANFKIVDAETGKRFYVDNDDFLTPFQQKQMATQPDFILEYAHYLKSHFENQGHKNIQVFVESHVALNGRLSSKYIDPNVDLGKQKESFKHKTWIIPFKDEIKGL
ncbi:HTTM domain-containing protein [Aquimarina sp. BL5]|uniref:HTTM domain-containing protein n=1 Tax=Aquimarina sp. BL5 TaxID=1714860 RepID=UPI000E53BCA4|nr:HTTM domain-containing protein [Aquimarina sp. BL5]AXT50769.1 HTTM domain-containing protein [Aquimarina sp. BL5]RKN04457.1 HTTM domain-containing protein [Aquimarina sp. BL5]